jgi:hypothetical protein
MVASAQATYPQKAWSPSQKYVALGFDHIRTIVLNLEQKVDEFVEVLKFLSCP